MAVLTWRSMRRQRKCVSKSAGHCLIAIDFALPEACPSAAASSHGDADVSAGRTQHIRRVAKGGIAGLIHNGGVSGVIVAGFNLILVIPRAAEIPIDGDIGQAMAGAKVHSP